MPETHEDHGDGLKRNACSHVLRPGDSFPDKCQECETSAAAEGAAEKRGTYEPHFVGSWFGWQAMHTDTGEHCTHRHDTRRKAQACADELAQMEAEATTDEAIGWTGCGDQVQP